MQSLCRPSVNLVIACRVEDTDQARSTPESEAAVLQDLEWIGIKWDEGAAYSSFLWLLCLHACPNNVLLHHMQDQTWEVSMAHTASLSAKTCT